MSSYTIYFDAQYPVTPFPHIIWVTTSDERENTYFLHFDSDTLYQRWLKLKDSYLEKYVFSTRTIDKLLKRLEKESNIPIIENSPPNIADENIDFHQPREFHLFYFSKSTRFRKWEVAIQRATIY